MFKNVLLYFFIGVSFIASAQRNIPDSLVFLINRQLVIFPQEKIYLHTDKPVYITGERIWFRAHLVDAFNHVPIPFSQYVYVEMFNPSDSLISRIKIRNDPDIYQGYIDIPRDIPEGDYVLRAYTNFMLNLDSNYLCTKTIRIGNPANRMLCVNTRFSFDADGKINADFSFSDLGDEPVVPEKVQVSVNGGKMQHLTVKADGTTGVHFELPAGAPKRILTLDAQGTLDSYRQYIPIPFPDDDFDVSFYPEGGYLLQDYSCRVAFKALTSGGRPVNVAGVVYDQYGNEKGRIKTDYMGMGSFTIYPEDGISYHAVCTNDHQQSKRFELPSALKTGYSLSVTTMRDNIYVTVMKSVPGSAAAYLLAHTRGMVHFATQCSEDKKTFNLPQQPLPSGVLHLVLFDEALNPVSERLVFVNNDDQAQVTFRSDRDSFAARIPVKSYVTLTDEAGNPLSGDFSVSVTADHALATDTTTGILTHLLLTSDLRGHIENPAAYFNGDRFSEYTLDLLMLTQGWRRYDMAAVAQGRLARPETPLELGPVISGRVKRLLIGRPVRRSQVSIASMNNTYFERAETDSDGRFSFDIAEQPDSTIFIVQAVPGSGNRPLELLIDEETFPEMTHRIYAPAEIGKNSMEQYVQAADPDNRMDKDKDIAWSLELPEVIVTAGPPVPESVFRASYVLEVEEENDNGSGMHAVLMRIPGIKYEYDTLGFGLKEGYTYRGASFNKVIIEDENGLTQTIDNYNNINGEQVDFIINNINTEKIKQIYLSEMFFADPPITNLIITVQDLITAFIEFQKFHIKTVQPLGYQKPVAFYAPKYDTPEAREDKAPDLRTTIHWQPCVRTDSIGMASFEFYTADTASSYTVVIEGMTTDGKIIRQEKKLWRNDEDH